MSGPFKPFPKYNPQAIESKWQQSWQEAGLYLASEGGEKPKFYCLEFFPYPSGDGLHVGHCRNYLPTDVLSRYKRMCGFNVLHPMGWDAFGEPAEQHAIAHNIHPEETTRRNTANFRRQLTLMGSGYDWSREIYSSDPEYYRWTQYFFLLLYRRGLAYYDANWQWWCPTCQTTLSSHEVAGGVCWRGHEGVIRCAIPAWYFRITAYADRLLEGLERIDWPDHIKAMQRNWIGRSEGVEVDFPIAGLPGETIPVFTTRPDTLFGVTFFILAPEHPQVERLVSLGQRAEVAAYIARAARRSEKERQADTPSKTGVFTGGYVTNPVNGERVPVWVADYVLMSYGTGAVMGVPAHDTRDFEFARLFGLPVRQVISPSPPGPRPGGEGSISSPPSPGERAATAGRRVREEAAYTDEGWMVNSGAFDDLPSQQGGDQIANWLEAHQLGKRTVQYHMRDWLISRQRYWGAPIPVVHCPGCGIVPVSEAQLPVRLPHLEDFQPDGSGCSPLGRVPEFVQTTCPQCGGDARRETDTMGGFACSSWYFLRFTSPHHHQAPFEQYALRYWAPPDLYVGGAEHAVLHLLYARFWTKVMYDAGLVPFDEPFPRLRNQGQLMGPDGQRMSKSRGNTITPDEVVQSHGADALRVYELFMAPFEADVDWSLEGLNGAWRFLNKVWSLVGDTFAAGQSCVELDPELERLRHRAIRQVSERIENFRFNTMISALMEFANALSERQRLGNWRTASFHACLETLLLLLAPAAPHITDELWALTGHAGSIHSQTFPAWDPDLARSEVLELAVQVDGKARAVIEVSPEMDEAQVKSLAMAHPRVQTHLESRAVQRVIYVPGRIVNIVTRPML